MSSARARLLYVVRGRTSVLHDAGQLPLRSGALAFLPAYQEYRGVPEPIVDIVTVYVDPVFATEQLRWLPHTRRFFESLLNAQEPRHIQVSPLRRPAIAQNLLEMVTLECNGDAAQELRVLELLTGVLARITIDDFSYSGALEPFLRREISVALEILQAGLEQRWSIGRLASEVALSPSQLTRVFTSQVGVTPARYIRELRAHRMRDLITTEDMTVAQAARAVGWPNPSVAARGYRSVFGRLPSKGR